MDCHSHTAISGGVNEGTNVCTAEVRIQDVINPEDVNIYRQLAGGVTGALMLHSQVALGQDRRRDDLQRSAQRRQVRAG
jgi:hypothetical protein